MDNKYYLGVETKPNNYFPINLQDLKLFNKNTTKLEEIDSLTIKYPKSDIIKAIKEANLLELNDNMALIIIYIEKDKPRKMPALTKDYAYDMWQRIKNNYLDKNYCNQIINFLNNKISTETLELLKNNKGTENFLNIISELPYIVTRKLYFYLYEK